MGPQKQLALGILLALGASASALASSDIDDCTWGSPGCYLSTPPVIAIHTDTRDNLLRLLGDSKGLYPLRQPMPADVTRSRNVYFGVHHDDAPPAAATEASTLAATLRQQMNALGVASDNTLPPALLRLLADGNDAQTATAVDDVGNDGETRFVSQNNATLSAFFAALLEDKSLTAPQRQALATARIAANESSQSIEAISALSFPENSAAAGFRTYLQAANSFYAGDYAAAEPLFTSLTKSTQPWLAETASYMLMRNALNASSENANGEYGDFDVAKIDKPHAEQARSAAESYLKQWPQGRYAASTQGMLRRIDWYLQQWDSLAVRYENALSASTSGDALVTLINESDNKLLSKDVSWGGDAFVSAPNASLMTFIAALRWMRESPCRENMPCIDNAWLESHKAEFDNNQRSALWNYLRLQLAYSSQDYATVVSGITPANALAEHDVLAFSEQVLYGDALMAQKAWPEAQSHWLHLLDLSRDVEQQQLLQAKLAATLVASEKVDEIFAAKSRVTNLRFRSLVLKTKASRPLLLAQAQHGPNSEERTIALHTLLMRDLTAGNYADWLQDKKLIAAITPPVKDEAFSDVDLNVFNWQGSDEASRYTCAALDKTVTTLSKTPTDGHALNCLGEFFRTTQARVSLGADRGGNDALDDATTMKALPGVPQRLAAYQQVINDPKAEPEDKSYALYRAVMCYAPSGYNDCGGEDVEKSVRKAWFQQLKSRYPGSVWANELRYYW